ncbi:MAG: hypothetical protein QM713_06620 [Arachnia sp.]
MEVETAGTIPELTEAAQTVALGRFVGDCGTRTVETDVEMDRVGYTCVLFAIDEVLAGDTPDDDRLPVELLGDAPDDHPDPTGNALLFLVRKRAPEDAFYRSVNAAGFWVESVDGKAVQPLSEEPDDSQTWKDFVQAVREQVS